jgi:hypothetical protein
MSYGRSSRSGWSPVSVPLRSCLSLHAEFLDVTSVSSKCDYRLLRVKGSRLPHVLEPHSELLWNAVVDLFAVQR